MAEFKRRLRFVIQIDWNGFDPDEDYAYVPTLWKLMPGLLEKRTLAVEVKPFFLARHKRVKVMKGYRRYSARAAKLLVGW